VKREGGGGAFARCLSLEHPNIRVLALDLPFGSPEAMTWIDAEAASAAPGCREAKYDRAGLRYTPISHDRSAGATERKAQRSPSHAPRDFEEQPAAERNAHRPDYEGINAVGHRNNSCALIRAAHETPAAR
jgi:hypothetical protein